MTLEQILWSGAIGMETAAVLAYRYRLRAMPLQTVFSSFGHLRFSDREARQGYYEISSLPRPGLT